MKIEYCDGCGMKFKEFPACLSDRKTLKYEVRTRYFAESDEAANPFRTLLLCESCAEKMYTYLENTEALRADIGSVTLANRLRFLFKCPMKHEKGVAPHENA